MATDARPSSKLQPPPTPPHLTTPRRPHAPLAPQNKRCIKRSKDNPGGIVSVESPLHYSNVSLVDPLTGSAARASWRFLEDGTKVRVTRGRLASASIVPRPDVLKQRGKPRSSSAGPADTRRSDAEEATHAPGDLPAYLRQRLVAAQQDAGQAQARQYHTGAAAAAAGSSGGGGGGILAAAAARLLGGRVQPLSGGRVRGLWRGFASSSLR